MMLPKIILASSSARRKQLLEWAEVDFEIYTCATAELVPPDMPVGAVPVHIAKEKALAVRKKLLSSDERLNNSDTAYPILAADTIVVWNDEIMGKPVDREHAITVLSKLQGSRHKVITGVVILHGESEIAFTDTTEVIFYPLTKEQIAFYIDKYQPYDKAGAYGIQEWIGVVGIQAVHGDFYNVMGLPVSRVIQALQEL